MQKLSVSLLAGLAAASLFYVGAGAQADDDHGKLRARLQGFNEVPAVFSTGGGEFRARIHGDIVDWELSYEGLEGSITTAAHIHFGQKDVNGGVSVFLCGGTAPACTTGSGTFQGTFSAADVVGPAVQGISAGEIAELISAVRAGNTYVNVHTNKHAGGEIRGQVRGNRND